MAQEEEAVPQAMRPLVGLEGMATSKRSSNAEEGRGECSCGL